MQEAVRIHVGLKKQQRSRFVPNVVPVQQGGSSSSAGPYTRPPGLPTEVPNEVLPHPTASPTTPSPPDHDTTTPLPPPMADTRPFTAPSYSLEQTTAPAFPDDLFSFLNAEAHADDMPQDDLISEPMDAQFPVGARTCPMYIRRIVRRSHRNLGHPIHQSLVRLMKMARCQQVALDYAKALRCPTGLRRRPPQRIPRATMPCRPTRFNHVVGLDLKFVRYTHGDRIYHSQCLGPCHDVQPQFCM